MLTDAMSFKCFPKKSPLPPARVLCKFLFLFFSQGGRRWVGGWVGGRPTFQQRTQTPRFKRTRPSWRGDGSAARRRPSAKKQKISKNFSAKNQMLPNRLNEQLSNGLKFKERGNVVKLLEPTLRHPQVPEGISKSNQGQSNEVN